MATSMKVKEEPQGKGRMTPVARVAALATKAIQLGWLASKLEELINFLGQFI